MPPDKATEEHNSSDIIQCDISGTRQIEIPALMDNATWEAEALEHEPDKLQ